MSRKKRPTQPKASMPTGIYDLDKVLGERGVAAGGDDLDRFLRGERKRQIDQIKSLQAKEIELTMMKRVKDLEKQVGVGSGVLGGVNPQELAQIAAMISQLPEDQRPIAVQALGAFRQGGGDTMGSLGPLLMVSMLQKQPQTSMTELVTALKGLNEITQGQQPKTMDTMSSVLQVAKMLGDSKDTAYQTQIQFMRKEIEDLKPHDPVAYQKQLVELMTSMGFKPGSGEVNAELETIKMNHETMLQKSNQEFQLLLKKMDRDDTRWETILGALAPAITSISGAASTRISTPTGQQQRTPLVCPSCQFSPIWVSPQAPVANCPQCGTPVTSQQYASRLQTGPAQPPPDEGLPPPPSSQPPPPPPGV